MQTLFATLGQLIVAGYISHCRTQAASFNGGDPILRVGTVSVLALSIYSIGRLVFFALREDENFKSNKSYTTAYMALGTLAGCMGVLCYSLVFAPASPIGLPLTSAAVAQVDAHWLNYLSLALVISLVTFIVQGLHHHDKVGVFPDLGALLGYSSAAAAGSSSVPPPDVAEGSEVIKGGRGRAKGEVRARQVFSTWEGN